MARVVYVNGAYVPYAEARVHVEDRGFQFGDGVYEVIEVANGCLIAERRHLARLDRSLDELRMEPAVEPRALGVILRETVRRNRVRDGLVYLQVTRGVARRDFAFPLAGAMPGIVCFARHLDRRKTVKKAARGISVVTVPDLRWKRVDIKTIGLLAQSLSREAAIARGADEAWMVDSGGFVTEGASCNAWIVAESGDLVTRPAGGDILQGITRDVTLEIARAQGRTVSVRAFSTEEAVSAREAFQTSATGLVMPVIKIDDYVIGGGVPGPVTLDLRSAYYNVAEISDPRAMPF